MGLVHSCSKCKREFIQKDGEDEEDFYHSIQEHMKRHGVEMDEEELKQKVQE